MDNLSPRSSEIIACIKRRLGSGLPVPDELLGELSMVAYREGFTHGFAVAMARRDHEDSTCHGDRQ